jgi:hypothetical protein
MDILDSFKVQTQLNMCLIYVIFNLIIILSRRCNLFIEYVW